jgi:hypothetical protein
VFLFWLVLMVLIWMYLLGMADVLSGHFSPFAIGMTIVVGMRSRVGRRRTPLVSLIWLFDHHWWEVETRPLERSSSLCGRPSLGARMAAHTEVILRQRVCRVGGCGQVAIVTGDITKPRGFHSIR